MDMILSGKSYLEWANLKWVTSIPPGGFVCAVCESPVDSEPCEVHGPIRDGTWDGLPWGMWAAQDTMDTFLASVSKTMSYHISGELSGEETLRQINQACLTAYKKAVKDRELIISEGE